LKDNPTCTQGILCGDINNIDLIEQMEKEKAPKIPHMRVMSISIRAIEPSKVKIKRLFNTSKIDELHIYAISYHVCEDYNVESKPSKPVFRTRTFFNKEFNSKFGNNEMVPCGSEL